MGASWSINSICCDRALSLMAISPSISLTLPAPATLGKSDGSAADVVLPPSAFVALLAIIIIFLLISKKKKKIENILIKF